MQKFQIGKGLFILCEYKNTRNGFKHTAKLVREVSGTGEDYHSEQVLDECKVCYLNRTWERYEFESVLSKMLDRIKELTPEAKKEVLERGAIDDPAMKTLGSVAMVAQFGDIFHGGDQKSSNDWKARMLKAGLGDSGLSMPEDWNKLTEDEKQRRLDGVINKLSS